MCPFTVAVNRSWKTDSGEVQEEAEFVSCIAWEKLAELISANATKGSSIYVEGRLKTRKYTKDDIEKTTTEIIANDVIFLTRNPSVTS